MLGRNLLIACCALVLSGCGADAEVAMPAAATDGTLAGTTLDGQEVSLADFRGQPVFVNVWSSW